MGEKMKRYLAILVLILFTASMFAVMHV